eukprot:15481372-Alexandrium_andersonii.AAC.1
MRSARRRQFPRGPFYTHERGWYAAPGLTPGTRARGPRCVVGGRWPVVGLAPCARARPAGSRSAEPALRRLAGTQVRPTTQCDVARSAHQGGVIWPRHLRSMEP